MLSRCDHLPLQHMTMPLNIVYHSQLIYCFIQTQHEVLKSLFSIFELFSTHCSYGRSFCPSQNSHFAFFQTPCFAVIHNCWPYIALVNSPFQLERKFFHCSNLPHSLSLANPLLVLAVTAASHPLPALTLSPRYVNSHAVYTSSHNVSSCSSASPIFPSHFLQAKFHDKWGHNFLSNTPTVEPQTRHV